MVSADVLKQIWQAIALAHIADLSFSSEWNKILDQNTEVEFPVCLWLPFGPSTITNEADALMLSHTVTMEFLDRTRTDRPADERDAVVSKMGIIAAQCWAKFYRERVMVDDATWQGEKTHFEVTSDPVFTVVMDETGLNLSGVRLTATLKSSFDLGCVTGMFT